MRLFLIPIERDFFLETFLSVEIKEVQPNFKICPDSIQNLKILNEIRVKPPTVCWDSQQIDRFTELHLRRISFNYEELNSC